MTLQSDTAPGHTGAFSASREIMSDGHKNIVQSVLHSISQDFCVTALGLGITDTSHVIKQTDLKAGSQRHEYAQAGHLMEFVRL